MCKARLSTLLNQRDKLQAQYERAGSGKRRRAILGRLQDLDQLIAERRTALRATRRDEVAA